MAFEAVRVANAEVPEILAPEDPRRAPDDVTPALVTVPVEVTLPKVAFEAVSVPSAEVPEILAPEDPKTLPKEPAPVVVMVPVPVLIFLLESITCVPLT